MRYIVLSRHHTGAVKAPGPDALSHVAHDALWIDLLRVFADGASLRTDRFCVVALLSLLGQQTIKYDASLPRSAFWRNTERLHPGWRVPFPRVARSGRLSALKHTVSCIPASSGCSHVLRARLGPRHQGACAWLSIMNNSSLCEAACSEIVRVGDTAVWCSLSLSRQSAVSNRYLRSAAPDLAELCIAHSLSGLGSGSQLGAVLARENG